MGQQVSDHVTEQVYEAAMKLPRSARAKLVEQLILSLDGPLPTAERQAEIDAAWAVEIDRRVRETDEGRGLLSEEESAELYRRLRAGLRP